MDLVLDRLGGGPGLGVAPEHLEARVVIIVVIFVIVWRLPITCVAASGGRKLLLFLSVVLIVSYYCVCVGTVPLRLPGAQAAHQVHSVTGAILVIPRDARFLEHGS